MTWTPEVLPVMPDVALMNAFQDAAMVAPKASAGAVPGPLFPSIIVFKLGGDAGLNDAGRMVTLPLPNIVVTIGSHYGSDIMHTTPDPGNPQNVPVGLGEIVIPFTVWGSSAQDLDDVRTRLVFARDHRQAVFDAHGITLRGALVNERRRPFDQKLGLVAEDYRWRFWWERT